MQQTGQKKLPKFSKEATSLLNLLVKKLRTQERTKSAPLVLRKILYAMEWFLMSEKKITLVYSFKKKTRKHILPAHSVDFKWDYRKSKSSGK